VNVEKILGFLDCHKEVKREQPGLYSLLADAAEDRFYIKEDEMEYLAQTRLQGREKADYLAELGRYRERNKQSSYVLTPEEMKIILVLRSLPEVQRREIIDFLIFKASKNNKK